MTPASQAFTIDWENERFTIATNCYECNAINSADFELNGYSNGEHVATELFARGYDITIIAWHPTHAGIQEVPDVPQGIAEAAGEAIACLNFGAYRAAVVMSRAVIEATCKHQGIVEKADLFQKINKLREAGKINKTLTDMIHAVRTGGNKVAHGDYFDPTQDVSEKQARLYVKFTQALLEEVYQRPRELERLLDDE